MAHAVILAGASGYYGRALACALAALPAGHPARPCSLALLGRSPAALAATAAAVTSAAAAATDVVAPPSESVGGGISPLFPPSRVRLTIHPLDLVTATPSALAAVAAAAVRGLPSPGASSAVAAAAAATDGGEVGVPSAPPTPPARVTLFSTAGVVALPSAAAAAAPGGDAVSAAVAASVAANAVGPLRLAAAVATAVGATSAMAAEVEEQGVLPPLFPPVPLTVVAVSSLLALVPSPLPEMLPYVVGKSAAEAAFRCLAAQWAASQGGGAERRVLNWAPGPLAGGGMRTEIRAAGVDDGLPREGEVAPADSAAALMDVLASGKWESGAHIDYFDVVGERNGKGNGGREGKR
ncbi:hypothetical protein MMPV_006412 [Pyropia vietnamensis]